MKNLKITETAHTKLKEYCDKNYLKISEWVSNEIIGLITKKNGEDNKKNKG
jgi:hypothetical protein